MISSNLQTFDEAWRALCDFKVVFSLCTAVINHMEASCISECSVFFCSENVFFLLLFSFFTKLHLKRYAKIKDRLYQMLSSFVWKMLAKQNKSAKSKCSKIIHHCVCFLISNWTKNSMHTKRSCCAHA